MTFIGRFNCNLHSNTDSNTKLRYQHEYKDGQYEMQFHYFVYSSDMTLFVSLRVYSVYIIKRVHTILCECTPISGWADGCLRTIMCSLLISNCDIRRPSDVLRVHTTENVQWPVLFGVFHFNVIRRHGMGCGSSGNVLHAYYKVWQR